MSDWQIPLSDLNYGAAESRAVERVLLSGWLSMGPEVQAFETEFADFIGTRHAIAVCNGTAALHLAFCALRVGNTDEVIQPAVNFVAAANMTVAVGATPVFADITGLEEPTIAPVEIERNISSKTRAVVVMHYGGYPCNMAAIKRLCEKYNLALIEDACHAVGAHYLYSGGNAPVGEMVGNLGDIACFSFFSNKNLPIGEGGMITTNRDDLAQELRILRSHGMSTMTWDRHKGHAHSYEVNTHGYNYRLDEIRAALGRTQLPQLSANNARRKQLVLRYQAKLSSCPGWTIPFQNFAGDSAYHLMVVVAPTTELRSQVAHCLRENGIQTSMHYPCISQFKAFARFAHGNTNKSQLFSSRALTLPLFPSMSTDQVDAVCFNLLDAVERETQRA